MGYGHRRGEDTKRSHYPSFEMAGCHIDLCFFSKIQVMALLLVHSLYESWKRLVLTQSKRLHHSPAKTQPEIAKKIIRIRDSLSKQGLFHGAQAILWEIRLIRSKTRPSPHGLQNSQIPTQLWMIFQASSLSTSIIYWIPLILAASSVRDARSSRLRSCIRDISLKI